MPPGLSAVLTALAVVGSPGESGGALMLLVFDLEELITVTGLSGRISQQAGCLCQVEGGAGLGEIGRAHV